MKRTLYLLLFFLISLVNQSVSQIFNPSFKPSVTAETDPTNGVMLNDGSYILTGSFIQVGPFQRQHFAKFNTDGSLNETFAQQGIPGVIDVKELAGGKLLIAGNLTTYNSQPVTTAVLRLNADGTIDDSFSSDLEINSNTTRVFPLPDGKIMVSGFITKINGVSKQEYLVRLNEDGSWDSSFDAPTFGGSIYSLAIDADGKILVGGTFSNVGGNTSGNFARLLANGAVDNTFLSGTGFNSWVYAIRVTSDNKILVGGLFTSYNGQNKKYLLALNSDGTIFDTFAGNDKPNNSVLALEILPDNKILVAGGFTSFNLISAGRVVRLNSDGSRDNTYLVGSGADALISGVKINNQGEALILGSSFFTQFNGQSRKHIATLNADGSLKPLPNELLLTSSTTARVAVKQGTDKILFSHLGKYVNGVVSSGFERFTLDGQIDPTFSNGQPNNSVSTIITDPDNNIFIGGTFTTYQAASAKYLAKLDPNGNLDATFNANMGTGFNNFVNYLHRQPDGKIIACGAFTSFNGILRKSILRLNADGTLDETFNSGNGFLNTTGTIGISTIKVQADGKILVGGEFSGFGGVTRASLFRLNVDGTLDETFNTGTGITRQVGAVSAVYAVEVLSDGKILVGGSFTRYNGVSIPGSSGYFLRLNGDGSLDSPLGIHGLFIVEGFARQPDGKILVLDRSKGISRRYADGSEDVSFPAVSLTSSASSILLFGKDIIVAGQLTSINGNSITSIGMVSMPEDPLAPTNFVANATSQTSVSLSWTDNATNETGYRVYRSTSTNENYQLLTTLAENSTTHQDNTAQANTTYFYKVSVYNAATDNLYTSEQSVSTPDYPPTAPSNLAIDVINASQLDLSWSDNSSNETGFEIERSLNNASNYGLIHTTAPNVTTYADEDVNGTTTYYYRIRAINGGGNSAYLASQSATPADPIPALPSNFMVTIVSASQLDLSWTDNSDDETAFELFRSLNGTDFTLLETTAVNVEAYSDVDVSAGNTYYYKLRAVNGMYLSEFTDVISAVAQDPIPNMPTNFTVNVVNGGRLDITWNDNSNDETAFELYRSIDGSNFYLLDITAANVQLYSDVDVTEGYTYYYKLRAVNGFFPSDYTPVSSGVPQDPVPPTPFVITAQSASPTSIILNWSDDSSDETGFEIYRSIGTADAFVLLTTQVANATQYTDNGLTTGTTYFYQVRAINVTTHGTYNSVFTQIVSAVPKVPGPVPPSDLTVTEVSLTSVILNWTDNASDEDEYRIMRSDGNNTNYVLIATLPPNTTSFQDNNLTSMTTYYYSVSGYNDEGESEAIIKSIAPGLHIMAEGSMEVCDGVFVDPGGLSNYPNNALITTTLYPSTPNAFVELTFQSFATEWLWDAMVIYDGENTSAPSLGTFDSNDQPGTIIATNPAGALTIKFQSNSSTSMAGWVANISCKIIPLKPAALDVDVVNENNVEISWQDVSNNEIGFIVQRSAVGEAEADFETIAELPANISIFSDTDVQPNTTYFYRIRAIGTDGNSPFTPIGAIHFGTGGYWKKKADLTSVRTDATAFAIDNIGYVGIGWAGGAQTAQFAKFDPSTNTWQTSDSFGGSIRSEASGFVINGKAYVGTGNGFDLENDLWQFDPSLNDWTPRADFAGTPREGTVAFSLAGNGYIGLGSDASGRVNDFWKYDPVGDSWSAIAPFPGAGRVGAVAFTIGDIAYVGTGSTASGRVKDFWKYTPQSNTWTAIAEFPGSARSHAVAFALDGKGYVGTGDGVNEAKDFWQYDPITNSWNQIVAFGGTARAYAVSFATPDHGYVATGYDGSNRKDLWEFTASTIPPAPVAPQLSIATVSSSTIELNWTYDPTNAGEFIIERSIGDETGYQPLSAVSGALRTFEDSGLTPETSYYYKIKVVTNESGSSAFSTSVHAVTLPLAPIAPSLNPASNIQSNQVTLSWIDNSSNETQFVLERSTQENSGFEQLQTLVANQTGYIDQSVSALSTYYYRIKSRNAGGDSPYSNVVSATTPIAPVSTPSNLLAVATSPLTIALSWSDNANNETSILVVRSLESAGPFSTIATLPANATSFEDAGLTENVTYYYKVRAVNDVAMSDFSTLASATTPLSVPSAPTQLSAVLLEDQGKIVLTWTDNSFNEDEFVIERSENGNTFTEYATTQTPTFEDLEFENLPKVFYRVSARNAQHTSSYSNVASIIITSIEHPNLLVRVEIYPNPAVESVSLQMKGNIMGTVLTEFTDITGKTLLTDLADKDAVEFNRTFYVNDWRGKLLLVRVSFGKESKIFKLLVK